MAYLTEIAHKTQEIPSFPIEIPVTIVQNHFYRISNVRNGITYYLGEYGRMTREDNRAFLFQQKPTIYDVLSMKEFSCETIGDFSSCDILDPNNWYIDKQEGGYIISFKTPPMSTALFLEDCGKLGDVPRIFTHTPSLTEIFNDMKVYYETTSIENFILEQVVLTVTKVEPLHGHIPRAVGMENITYNSPRYGI